MASNGLKYLEIKNWDRYQVKDRKSRDIRLYIKDYCAKDIDDPDYNSLSAYQRYVWDACCRIRGRSGRSLHADITWLARAMGLIGTDRPHLRHAIETLIARGFLIPSNQEVDLSDSESDTETDSDSETETEGSGTSALSDQGEAAPESVEDRQLLYSPTTKEEQDRFKELRLGEWEKGVVTRMVDEGTWKKRDVDRAIRLVLNVPESYPGGVTFQGFQELVEIARMVQ